MPFMSTHLPHKNLRKLSKDFGPLVGIFLGPAPGVVANTYEAIKHVLLNDDLNGRPKGPLIDDRTWGKTLG